MECSWACLLAPPYRTSPSLYTVIAPVPFARYALHMIEISILDEATHQGFEDIKVLLSQLRSDRVSTYKEPQYIQMEEFVSNTNSVAVVAKDGKKIVGMALLFIL